MVKQKIEINPAFRTTCYFDLLGHILQQRLQFGFACVTPDQMARRIQVEKRSVINGSPGPEVDPAWSAVFRRAMHPRPNEAYASLDALADAFERAARGEAPVGITTPPPRSLAPPVPVLAPRPDTPVAVPWMIGLGVVASLLLAVAVAVAVKLLKHPPAQEPAPVATVAPDPEASSAAPEASSAPPLASEVPSASGAPSASESAVADNPPPSEEPTIPPHDHRHGMLVVACTPSCDSVFVDGHPIAHAERGTLLDPGVHTLAANLANHASKVQSVMVHRGHVKRLNVAF